jgi:hypothetical protein
MGPLGRLEHLIDGQVTHYEPQYGGATGITPAKIEVEQRDAFVSLTSAARRVDNGATDTPVWTPPEALGSIGAQLVSICDAQPRVYTGTDWRTYPGARVLTQQLEQDVFHTSQHTIQAPDSAWLSGVTCSVWTETVVLSTGPVTTTYAGFKADSGAWVVKPLVLISSTTVPGRLTMAKVVTDGTRFWIVGNNGNATPTLFVNVFDIHGAFLGSGPAPTLPAGVWPGGSQWPSFWDVIAASSTGGYTVQLAIPVAVGNGTDSGVSFTSMFWNGSSVTSTTATDATIHCTGPVAWLTNDLGNGLAYLATATSLNDDELAVWAYEITNRAQTHAYGTGADTPPSSFALDTITGYTFTDGSGVGVVLSIGILARDVSVPTGSPAHDPGFRHIFSEKITRANVVSTLRTTQSVCQVSRAFAIDGEYYVFAYYQSGSGLAITPHTASVTITNGDYMIGAATQSVPVQAGDELRGSPATVANGTSAVFNSVFKSGSQGSTVPTSGDTVTSVVASGYGSLGVPDGTLLLQWNLAGISSNSPGSRIIMTSTSALASTFDILFTAASSHVFWTPANDIFGNGFTGATLTATGHYVIESMTGYLLASLDAQITTKPSADTYTGGTIVVTGASHSGNNGTFTIARANSSITGGSLVGGNPRYQAFPSGASAVWVVTTSQSTQNDTFSAVVTPVGSNSWYFGQGLFDATYVGTDLVVSSNAAVPTNIGTFPVTSVTSTQLIVTSGATGLLPQVFGVPLPTIDIVLTTQVPYTFNLQGITLDYTYIGALVSVQGADAVNNGVYKIVQIVSAHVFVAQPQNGLSNQINEALGLPEGTVVITIFFAQNIQPEFQSTWFIVPLSGSQPVVGRFEYALAYADWRIEADSTLPANLYQMGLSSPRVTTVGTQIILPYRAQNVTAATLETTPAGEVNIVAESFVSTVGLKAFTLSATTGTPAASNGELSIPGPMAVVFTPSGFIEDGQNLAPEAPYLVSQSAASSGQLGLTLGGIYFVVAVLEFTDENGNRTYSPPSPALQINMGSTNNVATYGGRLPYPLSSTGGPVTNTYGPTTRLSGISLYRTAFLNGEPTTQHYKITDDLNINGLAPIATSNPSGFSFPDTFTWQYIDQNPDAGLNANEILYTDKSLLPRFPAPAGPQGPVSWKNREWIIGYDDAIWMSGEKAEGDAVWFNPVFRFPFPAEDAPLGVAGMDDYLIVVCEASVWYIPAAQFPDATGGNGGLPTPVRLPFPNGSRNGFARTIREGVAYDSTDGGVWLVTRQLQNQWLSHPLLETLTGSVVGMAVDQGQRLFVLQKDKLTLCVYDGIPGAWYEWQMPSQGLLLAVFNGQAVYQDAAVVAQVTPQVSVDTIAGVSTGIPGPDATLAELVLGNVRGLKKVWEFQAVGTYEGPHNANAVLTYPEDGWPSKTYKITPASTDPYVLPFNPNPEDASTYKVRIFPDFAGIVSPGATFRFEMLSAQVGMEPIGLNKRPAFVTMKES